MDRIDLHVEVPPVTAADLALPRPVEGTAEAARRIAAARAVQEQRNATAAGETDPAQNPINQGALNLSPLNAHLEGKALEAAATPDEAGRALLTRAAQATGLSARGWTRTLRLARTIADLEGAEGVRRVHVAEALIYRPQSLNTAADLPQQANPTAAAHL
jgi:magnesium chelatase family protein